jgi:hypothetical protein
MSDAYTLTKTAMDTLTGVRYAASSELGSLANPLPATYIVGSLISDVPEQHADNDETAKFLRIQLSIYSTGGLVNLPNTDAAMKSAGFKRGPARELPYDRETGHYGMAREYTILLN